MTLSKEQAEAIKKQLFSEIGKLPQENKEEIKKQIQGLNEEQLEQFLEQNKIDISKSGQISQGQEGKTDSQQSNPCIFCSIAKNQIPSHKLIESEKAIAILEINPLSKGHSIIIPLEHIKTEKLPKSALSLAQKIAKKIKTKLKPEDIKIETSSLQGHSMINIIPIYKNGKLEKHQADENELKELQLKLQTKKRSSRKNKKQQNENNSGSETKEYNIDQSLPQITFRVP